MTKRTLIEALRADVHAKFTVVRTMHEIDQAFALVSETVDLVRASIQQRDEQGASPDTERRIVADLVTLEAVTQELAERLLDHKLALDNGLFGAGNTENTK
ncbi:hypothetical protein AiwAL_18225 [Acidiphilium sp. AL]|uniref:Uncharacterized protein n=1 Tax=Acidiphilium iwatense TaxID=768198 RepID=A0ABS9E0N4_9PROT|nr:MULTISPECIES: hypothetical protein [Acidiphilium]MCF3948556.1 hypothetical protein [Acidiphilium iwatense]MCU4161999.1 hypothetical protein [Acidiphilium sp. AL]